MKRDYTRLLPSRMLDKSFYSDEKKPMTKFTKVFFDIETTAIPYENLSIDQLHILNNMYISKLKSVQLKSHTTHTIENYKPKEEELKTFLLQNWWFHAWLSRLLCVSMWWEDAEWDFKTHSFASFDDEKQILEWLKAAFDRDYILIWHNILGFDIPYLQHKYMQYQVKIPNSLQLHWVKPWDMRHQDTQYIYRWWQFQNTSLENLCLTLWVVTPKDTWIKWSQISWVYESILDWSSDLNADGFMQQITTYCEADVLSTYACYVQICNVLNVK